MDKIEPGLYRHFKGNNYLIISTVFDTENDASFVLYTAESKKEYKLWIRPLEYFFNNVETSNKVEKRFTYIRKLKEEEKQLLRRRLFA